VPAPCLLWVTDEVPHPGLGGGSIRQYHLLKRLAHRIDIDVVVLGRGTDPSLRGAVRNLHEIERPRPIGNRWCQVRSRLALLPALRPAEVALSSPSVRALRTQLFDVDQYDVVQVEHEWLAPLLPRRRRGRWFITLHNLLSVRLRQSADVATKARVQWLLRRDAVHADRLERWIEEQFDRVITVSEEDASLLGGTAAVIPNGVDLDAFTVTPVPHQPRLVFTASWNWAPNSAAAVWAATELLPRVRAQLPHASLALVGREPTAAVRALSSWPGVETHFDVPSVLPHLRSARIALVPLTVGSGTRLKALEAMAAGRPVVGTRIGLEGLGVVDGRHARLAESADEMTEVIVELAGDDRAAGLLAANGRGLVENGFGWDAIADRYWDLLQNAG
jgi:glycosyltransferase involved in cell wall biosynthesis